LLPELVEWILDLDGLDRFRLSSIQPNTVSDDLIELMASHEKFAEKYELPFPLIADPDKKILNTYGVYGERSLYGRKFMGTNRTTFLIDEKGKIVHVFKRPKVKEHSKEILDKFGA
ncbi:MAG: redoxin domain-containing protein, partial [Rhodothermales bacterium]|nr:redoxin domain-containing protein [Rhodothermales bacterium]